MTDNVQKIAMFPSDTSSAVLFSQSVMSDTVQPHELQHTRLPCPSLSPQVCSNSYPFNWWCHPAILFSVISCSSCLQSFLASGYFPMRQLFAPGGQSTEASASLPVLPMTTQDWFPLGLTGLISLLSKEISSVFSSTTVQKHQFFGSQFSLWSNSYISIWLLEKT